MALAATMQQVSLGVDLCQSGCNAGQRWVYSAIFCGFARFIRSQACVLQPHFDRLVELAHTIGRPCSPHR